MKINEKILLKTHGSKRELALKTGIHYSTVLRMFKNPKTIKPKNIIIIMEKLKLKSFDEIFERRN